VTTPDFQPTLVGETVLIRPLRAEDWPAMFKAASDPLIWEQHPARDRYTEAVFRTYFDGAMSSGMAVAFVDRATNEIIGSSRYHGYDAALSEVEIGWTFIVRSHWGRGTNAEIKRLMIGHALTFLDTVVFWVGETNWRSRRAMEKIGGGLRDGLHTRALGGAGVPHVIYEIKNV